MEWHGITRHPIIKGQTKKGEETSVIKKKVCWAWRRHKKWIKKKKIIKERKIIRSLTSPAVLEHGHH